MQQHIHLFLPCAPVCFFLIYFVTIFGASAKLKRVVWKFVCGSFMNVAWPRSSSGVLARDTRVISYPCHVDAPINYAAGSAEETILMRLSLAPLCGKYKHVLIRDERTFECLALWVNRSRCLQEALLSLCHASPWGSVFILSLSACFTALSFFCFSCLCWIGLTSVRHFIRSRWHISALLYIRWCCHFLSLAAKQPHQIVGWMDVWMDGSGWEEQQSCIFMWYRLYPSLLHVANDAALLFCL